VGHSKRARCATSGCGPNADARNAVPARPASSCHPCRAPRPATTTHRPPPPLPALCQRYPPHLRKNSTRPEGFEPPALRSEVGPKNILRRATMMVLPRTPAVRRLDRGAVVHGRMEFSAPSGSGLAADWLHRSCSSETLFVAPVPRRSRELSSERSSVRVSPSNSQCSVRPAAWWASPIVVFKSCRDAP
jgi:hypothetical protein